ncbi:acyltransferase family protein [Gryllotalpicola reticulitermitis]|uniref:Acyltransferase family protein n=1 Tax=Gryllotalpicola reticulitermitis TaxID=1184153 RepID=A0ABV8Q552_9MICO
MQLATEERTSEAVPQASAQPAPRPAGRSHRPRLSPRARAGLDAARACSAIYVMLHHTSTTLPMPAPLTWVLSFGEEAVMVFFLLSGFVIFANESDRVGDLRSFYLRRLRRIYPLVLIAMGVSTAVWAVGVVSRPPNWRSALATVLSLDDLTAKPGIVSGAYLGNAPLWSLSYEVFFYAIFPLVMVLWRRTPQLTRHLVGAVAVAAYLSYIAAPNHFSLVTAYFALWWAGAAAAKAHLDGGIRLGRIRVEAVWLGALTLAAVGSWVVEGWQGPTNYPFLMVRHFGVALGLLLVLATPVRTRLATLALRGAPVWAWVASISYGIYALHYPIVIQTSRVFGWEAFAPMVALTVACAWVVERRLMPLIPRPKARARANAQPQLALSARA